MKKRMFLFVVIAMIVSVVHGQDGFELSEVNVSGGKSAITSGLDVKIVLKKDNLLLGGQVNHQRVYGMYGSVLSEKVTLLATGGYFQNTPWLGAEAFWSPFKSLTIVGWYGHAMHDAKESFDWAPQTLFAYFAGFLQVTKNVTVSYTVQEFYGWLNLPGCKYTKQVGKEFSVYTGVDYALESNEPYFCLGLKYVPKH